jgi:Secretion system C-terminal sorting domain
MQYPNSKPTSFSKSILSQFATYRNAIARVFFVTTFLVISFLASLPEVSQAQCPDSTGPAPNPDSVAWTQDTTEQMIPGTDCLIWIYYCERTIPGSPSDTVQGWLDGVLIDSNTDCDSLSDSTIIIDAQLMLDTIIANDNYSKLEPCFKGSTLIVQAYSPACWEPHNVGLPGAGGLYVSPCISSGAYCEKECQVCYNVDPDFQFVFSGCVEYSLGLAECSGGGSWMPGGCFQASCAGFFVPPGPPRIETQLGVDTKTPVDTSMQAYPNPASGSLTITSVNSGEPVQILDVLGRVVMNGVISTNGSLTLDVSSLSTGTYYVSAGHTEVKFIKN